MGWSQLDHTGDLGLEIDAPDPETLFAEALRGFTDCITEVGLVGAGLERRVELTAGELDLLFVDWLEEALFLFDTEGLLFSAAEVVLVPAGGAAGGEVCLRSSLRGERWDAQRHPLKTAIKAVTYHGLALTRRGRGWRARVVFDL